MGAEKAWAKANPNRSYWYVVWKDKMMTLSKKKKKNGGINLSSSGACRPDS